MREARLTQVEISLRERSRSLSFLLVVNSISLLLGAQALLIVSAASFKTPSQGRLLLALDSDDPQLQNRLGQVYRAIDPAESVRHLRRATDLSPYSRRYWSDLAAACEATVDVQCADEAIKRLLKLCPMVPLYHWLAAKSYLAADRLDESVAQFRRLLELDRRYAKDTWLCLRNVQEPDLIFQEMLADSVDTEIRVGYVDFLSTQGDDDAAYRIWKLIMANTRSFPFSTASRYLERLIGLGRIEEAVTVWQDLERLGIVQRSKDENDNLTFNGDFEQVPLNAGFDWRPYQIRYLSIDFSAPGAYHGAHCLRVDFTVNRNDEYEPVYQIVPVLPNRKYFLNAAARSEGINSSTGPCLRVQDVQQPSFPDITSEPTVGTTPWHPVHLSFMTGPETRSIRLSVWRARGRVFPTEISGSFWLDAVSLRPVDSPLVRK